MAAFINTTPKLIVSTTLAALEWDRASLVNSDIVDALSAEKQKPGGEICVFGSGTLVTSLLSAELVDELRLLVHPIMVGNGQRLFDGGAEPRSLTLTDTRTFNAGIVSLTYKPTRRSAHDRP
jgi:dihydrofolate reductase